jgi:hypothetical protein
VGPICGLHRPLAQEEEEEETQEEQETQEEEEEEEKEEKANAAAPPPPLLSFNRSFSPPPLLSFAAPLNESFVFSQHSRIQHNGRLEGGEAGGLGVAQLETSSSWVCHMRRRIHTSEGGMDDPQLDSSLFGRQRRHVLFQSFHYIYIYIYIYI